MSADDFCSASYAYEYQYEDEEGTMHTGHGHGHGHAPEQVRTSGASGSKGVIGALQSAVDTVKDKVVSEGQAKIAVSEALLRWVNTSDPEARANIIDIVAEHRVRRLYRKWLSYMTALLTVGHFVFFLLMVSAVNERFHYGHLAFPLATGLFAFGGFPIWTQKTKYRQPIPRMHMLLQWFFIGVGVYWFATMVAHLAGIFNVKSETNHFCRDRGDAFLCARNGVSSDWLRAAFVIGSLISAASITTIVAFVLRYVYVYMVFLEWSWLRHHVDSPHDALVMPRYLTIVGKPLVKIGVYLKRKLLACCTNGATDHDSEAEYATTHPDYAPTTPEQQEDLVSSDEISGSEQEESYYTSSSSSGSLSGDDLASAACATCCCVSACCALVGCIVLTGAAREISCLLFYIFVETASS